MTVVDDLRLNVSEAGEKRESLADIQALYALSLNEGLAQDLAALQQREKFNVCESLSQRVDDFSATNMSETPVGPARYRAFLRNEVLENAVNLFSSKFAASIPF